MSARVMVVVFEAEMLAVLFWVFSTANWPDVSPLGLVCAGAPETTNWAPAVAFSALLALLPVAWATVLLPFIEKLEAVAFGSE